MIQQLTLARRINMAFDLAEYHQKAEERRIAAGEGVGTFKQTIKDAGVEKFTADYSGSGDDGTIYNVEVKPEGIKIQNCEWEEWNRLTHNKESHTGHRNAEEFIEDYCYDLLQAYYAGWEIDDGQRGTFSWNSRNNNIRHDYQQMYIRDECEEF